MGELEETECITESENMIIDSVVHPLAGDHWSFILDGVLHALNEEDPIQSFIKFLRVQRARTSKADTHGDALAALPTRMVSGKLSEK